MHNWNLHLMRPGDPTWWAKQCGESQTAGRLQPQLPLPPTDAHTVTPSAPLQTPISPGARPLSLLAAMHTSAWRTSVVPSNTLKSVPAVQPVGQG